LRAVENERNYLSILTALRQDLLIRMFSTSFPKSNTSVLHRLMAYGWRLSFSMTTAKAIAESMSTGWRRHWISQIFFRKAGTEHDSERGREPELAFGVRKFVEPGRSWRRFLRLRKDRKARKIESGDRIRRVSADSRVRSDKVERQLEASSNAGRCGVPLFG